MLHHLAQFAAVARAVAAAEAEQHAEVMDLEHVRQIRRIAAPEQLLQILEKDLAGDMRAEKLFLQRLAQPIAKDRVLRIQDGFIEKRHRGEGGEAHIVGVISGCQALIGRGFERFARVVAESLGIGDALAVAAQPFDGGEDFLKNEREVFGPADCRRTGLIASSPARLGFRFPARETLPAHIRPPGGSSPCGPNKVRCG